jgi:hypothetical protein
MSSAREPFDSPDWMFELKDDQFRSLAYMENGRCRLISRNGHEFGAFGDLCASVSGETKSGPPSSTGSFAVWRKTAGSASCCQPARLLLLLPSDLISSFEITPSCSPEF